MPDEINTKAETLLDDWDFSGENAHLAMTINAFGGSASQVSEERAYLYKNKNKNLTDEQKVILNDIKKAQDLNFINLETSLNDALRQQVLDETGISLYTWVVKFSEDTVIYEVDYSTYSSTYSVTNGVVTINDDRVSVERKTIYVEVSKSSDTFKSESFAYTPDLEDPLVWKFRIDSKENVISALTYLNKSSTDLGISEEDLPSVINKVSEAYTKFFPEAKELPEVLKATEISNTSGAASDGSKDENVPCGINKNKKDNMPDNKDVKVVEKSEDSKKIEELQKAVQEMTDLAKAAEKRAEDVQKAADAEKAEIAKSQMTEVVNSWNLENTEDVVKALLCNEESTVLIDALEEMSAKVEKAKEDFGTEEKGKDGDIVVSDNSSRQARVDAILKSKKAKKS